MILRGLQSPLQKIKAMKVAAAGHNKRIVGP